MSPHSRRTLARTALLTGLTASAALSAGCVIIAADSDFRYRGNYVSPNALSSVHIGDTDRDEVEALLGPPTAKSTLKDGHDLWRWDYTITKEYDGHVLLLFSHESSKDIKQSTYVQFDENGVVEKKWTN